jgi:hypothetical protein
MYPQMDLNNNCIKESQTVHRKKNQTQLFAIKRTQKSIFAKK